MVRYVSVSQTTVKQKQMTLVHSVEDSHLSGWIRNDYLVPLSTKHTPVKQSSASSTAVLCVICFGLNYETDIFRNIH